MEIGVSHLHGWVPCHHGNHHKHVLNVVKTVAVQLGLGTKPTR